MLNYVINFSIEKFCVVAQGRKFDFCLMLATNYLGTITLVSEIHKRRKFRIREE